MEPELIETIQKKLRETEEAYNVNIVYAAESGSRAWGLESSDSDYDVRFIYAHTKNWYLNILPKRDVIEHPIVDKFDCSGWDLRKALFLMNKSNPALFEWLKSPIVYYKDDYFYTIMEGLSKEYFSPIASAYHYLNMANETYRQFLQGENIKVKKYFYALRPIMACMWIEKHNEAPPMEFDKLLAQITEKELLEEIVKLLEKKKSGIELDIKPKAPIIHSFIEDGLKHFEHAAKSFDPRKNPSSALLEDAFIKILENNEKNARPLEEIST